MIVDSALLPLLNTYLLPTDYSTNSTVLLSISVAQVLYVQISISSM